ncbi:unnamed protein product [Orchesella dallaii]|uniref:Uncharacterized protein n=1 Tax=Orchesella dallaii TaxID=48710 RepID=A0ABP1QC64_9HEXA
MVQLSKYCYKDDFNESNHVQRAQSKLLPELQLAIGPSYFRSVLDLVHACEVATTTLEARDKIAKRPFTIPPLRASGREGYGKKAVAPQEGHQAMGRGNSFRFHIQGRWRGGSRRGEPDRGRMGRGHMQRCGFQHYGNGSRRPYGIGVYPTRGRGENRGGDHQNGNNRGNNRAMSSRGRGVRGVSRTTDYQRGSVYPSHSNPPARRRKIPTAFDRGMSRFNPKPNDTVLQQLKTLPKNLKRHIEWVKKNIRRMQKSNKTYYDRKHIPHPFKAGDKVMIRNHARSDKTAHKIQKLLRKWIGPFLLGAKAEDNDVTFEILTIPDFRRVGRRHVNDLRPYVERRTVRRRLVTSPNVDSIDNADEPEDAEEEQVNPAPVSRRVRQRLDYRTLAGYKTRKRTNNPQMSRQLNCKPESKFRKERRDLDGKYGGTTHPFYVTYPGYPRFKEFIRKINAKDFFPRQSNPHFVRVREFDFPTDYLKSEGLYGNGPQAAKDTIRVDTFKTLVDMVVHLNEHERFATDMEGGAVQGYHGSHPALIQFSTKSCDFYVQPYMIWESMDLLRPVMENPKIVKFMFVESNLPGVKMDKSLTNFDWARRELEPEAIRYALEDSRFLFQAWDNYAMDLEGNFDSKTVEIQGALIKVMINGSKPFPPSKPPSLGKLGVSGTERSQNFYLLWNWRDDLARERDISPRTILLDEDIVHQANTFPGFGTMPTWRFRKNHGLKLKDVDDLKALVEKASIDQVMPKKKAPIASATAISDEPNDLEALDLQLHADLEGLAELEITPRADGQTVAWADDEENWDEAMDIDCRSMQQDTTKLEVPTETVIQPAANGQCVDWANDSDDSDESMDVYVYVKGKDDDTEKPIMKSVVKVIRHTGTVEAKATSEIREVTDHRNTEMRVNVPEPTTDNEVVMEQATPVITEPIVMFMDHFPMENRKRIVEFSEKINWAEREQEMREEGIVCTIMQEAIEIPLPILPIAPPVQPATPPVPHEPGTLGQLQPAMPHAGQHLVRPCFICYTLGHIRRLCPYFKVQLTPELREQFKLNKQQYMDNNPEYKQSEMQRKAVNKVMNRTRKLDPAHQELLLHRIQQGRIQKNGGLHGEDLRRW